MWPTATSAHDWPGRQRRLFPHHPYDTESNTLLGRT